MQGLSLSLPLVDILHPEIRYRLQQNDSIYIYSDYISGFFLILILNPESGRLWKYSRKQTHTFLPVVLFVASKENIVGRISKQDIYPKQKGVDIFHFVPSDLTSG